MKHYILTMVNDRGNRACYFMMVVKGERLFFRVQNCSCDDWQGPLRVSDGLIMAIFFSRVQQCNGSWFTMMEEGWWILITVGARGLLVIVADAIPVLRLTAMALDMSQNFELLVHKTYAGLLPVVCWRISSCLLYLLDWSFAKITLYQLLSNKFSWPSRGKSFSGGPV